MDTGSRQARACGAQTPSAVDALIELGEVRGAFGVRGWIRIAPYSSDAEVLLSTRRWWLLADGPPRQVDVLDIRRHGTGLVAKWKACEEPEAAERFKGARVAVTRSDFPALPPGEYYWADLVGLLVVNRSGRELGRVRSLRVSAAHDLLEIDAGCDRPDILVPVIGSYVESVDLGQGVIQVDWEPEWLN